MGKVRFQFLKIPRAVQLYITGELENRSLDSDEDAAVCFGFPCSALDSVTECVFW